VLHETGQVTKADVDYLDALIPCQLNDLCSSTILHFSSLARPGARQLNKMTGESLVPLRFGIIAHV
jgi:hypothetical protein